MLGERIRLARRIGGFSLRALAGKVGVTAQAISKYELDRDIPSSGVLLRLSKALGIPVSFFIESDGIELCGVAFRKRSTLGKKDQGRVAARVQDIIERRIRTDRLLDLGKHTGFHYPPGFPRKVKGENEVEVAAGDLRVAWELGFGPVECLAELLEARGIKIALLDNTPSRFDALTASAGDNSPVIAVRADAPGDRQRFNLAHELGHIMLQPKAGMKPESAANHFAGAFLAPDRAVKDELGRRRSHLMLTELASLKEKYGLSMQAWVYRAKQLGIIGESAARRLFADFRRNGWNKVEPGNPYPPEKLRSVERQVIQLIAEDVVSRQRAAELLGRSTQEFEELMGEA